MMQENLQNFLSKFQPLLILLLIPELNLMQRANCKPIASLWQTAA